VSRVVGFIPEVKPRGIHLDRR